MGFGIGFEFFLCSRVADFKYYNINQASQRALEVSRKILKIREGNIIKN